MRTMVPLATATPKAMSLVAALGFDGVGK